jgi:alkylated DNA repair dioxygenase AlkB/SAM-dependent methyltransferase
MYRPGYRPVVTNPVTKVATRVGTTISLAQSFLREKKPSEEIEMELRFGVYSYAKRRGDIFIKSDATTAVQFEASVSQSEYNRVLEIVYRQAGTRPQPPITSTNIMFNDPSRSRIRLEIESGKVYNKAPLGDSVQFFDADMRLAIASEEYLRTIEGTTDEQKIAGATQVYGFQGVELVRQRKRQSYLQTLRIRDRDVPIRWDFTLVRSGKSMDNLTDVTYEIEVEFLSIENLYRDLIVGAIEIIYKTYQNSLFIIGKQEKQQLVIQEINQMLDKRNKNRTFVNMKYLNKPVALNDSALKGILENMRVKSQSLRDEEEVNDYGISNKADGLRCLLFGNQFGLYLISPISHRFVKRERNDQVTMDPRVVSPVNKISDRDFSFMNATSRDPTIPTGYTLLDCEFVPVDKETVMILVFDALLLNGHNVMSLTLESRMSQAKITVDKIVAGLGPQVSPKVDMKFKDHLIGGSFYDRVNYIFSQIPRMPYKNDGLIFTPVNAPYSNQITYKWKSPEMNTIDFKVVVNSDNTLSLYYVKDDGLEVFRGNERYPFDGQNMPLHSSSIMPLAQIQNQIVEFQYKQDLKLFLPIRIRTDKTQPNAVHTVMNTWQLLNNPLFENTVRGLDLTLYRSFHNSLKAKVLDTLKPESLLLDIGGGKGGDIEKWMTRKLNVTSIEPYDLHAEEFERRVNIREGAKERITLVRGDASDPAVDLKDVRHDAATLFFCLTFFFDAKEHLQRLVDNLKRGLGRGARVLGITMDGEKVVKGFKEFAVAKRVGRYFRNRTNMSQISVEDKSSDRSWVLTQGEYYEIFRPSTRQVIEVTLTQPPQGYSPPAHIVTQAYTLRMMETGDTSTVYGKKVFINLEAATVKDQVEYLVYMEEFVRVMEENGFVLKALTDVPQSPLLSPSQLLLSNMYTMFDFEYVSGVLSPTRPLSVSPREALYKYDLEDFDIETLRQLNLNEKDIKKLSSVLRGNRPQFTGGDVVEYLKANLLVKPVGIQSLLLETRTALPNEHYKDDDIRKVPDEAIPFIANSCEFTPIRERFGSAFDYKRFVVKTCLQTVNLNIDTEQLRQLIAGGFVPSIVFAGVHHEEIETRFNITEALDASDLQKLKPLMRSGAPDFDGETMRLNVYLSQNLTALPNDLRGFLNGEYDYPNKGMTTSQINSLLSAKDFFMSCKGDLDVARADLPTRRYPVTTGVNMDSLWGDVEAVEDLREAWEDVKYQKLAWCFQADNYEFFTWRERFSSFKDYVYFLVRYSILPASEIIEKYIAEPGVFREKFDPIQLPKRKIWPPVDYDAFDPYWNVELPPSGWGASDPSYSNWGKPAETSVAVETTLTEQMADMSIQLPTQVFVPSAEPNVYTVEEMPPVVEEEDINLLLKRFQKMQVKGVPCRYLLSDKDLTYQNVEESKRLSRIKEDKVEDVERLTPWIVDGMVRIGITGDGNCLFYSILRAFHTKFANMSSKEKSNYVRRLRRDLGLALTEKVFNGLAEGELKNYTTYEEFLENLSVHGEWGTTDLLEFIGDQLNLDIYVIHGNSFMPYAPMKPDLVYKNRLSIIIYFVDDNHYEVGGLRFGDCIQTAFPPDHPYIERLRNYHFKRDTEVDDEGVVGQEQGPQSPRSARLRSPSPGFTPPGYIRKPGELERYQSEVESWSKTNPYYKLPKVKTPPKPKRDIIIPSQPVNMDKPKKKFPPLPVKKTPAVQAVVAPPVTTIFSGLSTTGLTEVLPPGLMLKNDFLTPEQQKLLVDYFDSKTWNEELKRRTQHYGYKYDYNGGPLVATNPMEGPIKEIADFLRVNNIIDAHQCIVNEYDQKDYINAHTDSPQFGDIVVSISLTYPTEMIFSRGDVKVPVILRPGSIIVMGGESRHSWKHEIKGTISFMMDGKKYSKPKDYRRISLTYRNLKK